ncbi:MAG: hypothetical protein ABSG91_12205 [Syntrophobacteraceae bacterium]|jgi:hypothetical protein
MNCLKHIREKTEPEALVKAKEREELQEFEELLADADHEEDYIS